MKNDDKVQCLETNLLGVVDFLRFHGLPQVLRRDPARLLRVELRERGRVDQLVQLQKDVEKLDNLLQVLGGLRQRVHHLLADGPVERVSLQHRDQHGHHLVLQVQKFSQKVQLRRLLGFGQFVLHVGEEEEEAPHGVPQAGVRQAELIVRARSLDGFGEGVEDLGGDLDGPHKIPRSRRRPTNSLLL